MINSLCPICKSANVKIIFQNHILLFKCRICGIIFNEKHYQINYDDKYFTDQYKEQYGKTYEDDYENIYSFSYNRINKIVKLLHNNKHLSEIRLLDIGSAMGFFLKAAHDFGIKDILGIEISEYAAEYCKQKFGIDVINASFQEIDLNKKYEIISAWFFIEHCFDPLSIITKIYNSLCNGGIFAFSTPSFFGPQYMFGRNEWYNTHPLDHRVDFSPGNIKRLIKKLGFSKIFINPGSIHPERMLSEASFFYKPFKTVYSAFSKLSSFSDTMEIYAVK